MKPGYIYIGGYFHHHGKDLSNLTEKKIGKSIDVPARESALNSTKFTIGYTMIKFWKVDDMDIFEKSIHAILDNTRLNGEWFDDADETLVDRVSEFMKHQNAVDQTVDTANLEPAAEKIVKEAKDRSKVSQLAGQKFSYSREYNGENYPVIFEVTPDGKFFCEQTQTTYDRPNGPFTANWCGVLPVGKDTINAWVTPKNDKSRSLDQELALLP